MSESHGDTPTGRFSARPRIARAQTPYPSQQPHHPSGQFDATQPISTQTVPPPGPRSVVTRESARRWNIGRDVAAAVLLVVAPLFPWNLYFGGGIPGGRGSVFALLIAATVLSLGSIAATYAGPENCSAPLRPGPDWPAAGRTQRPVRTAGVRRRGVRRGADRAIRRQRQRARRRGSGRMAGDRRVVVERAARDHRHRR
ncbi:integral membrane domain protein [Mycobacterium xenopi 4042]|uniref:Integral membrane domain protein n=1 Tax=Mycobacterium xenopi 4042 TaxID=1299334 RepID=X8C7T9_MYCXE|nr:integral membrane domain protein [Mycobacterium xenopi 4042]